MKVTAPFLVLFLLAANSALAQVQMSTVSVPSTVANPISSGFTINYTMLGSKVGLASAQVTFYMSTSPTGSTGVYQLASYQILLNSSGSGLYSPPPGTQTRFISASGLPSNTYSLWQAIAAACQPTTWYVLGRVDFGNIVSSSTSSMGTTKLPDFYFTAGTISPTSIQPGGTTNISFDLYTQCPASSGSTVGVYLADASYSPLAYIGGISISAGAGTFSLPPTPITFSSSITPGNYTILLIADEDGVVAESNESNNGGAFNLTVTTPLAPLRGEVGEEKLNTELPVELSPSLYSPRMSGAADYIFQGI
ncbi:CARDB domain-containing protein [Hyalangium versicolor]|uniref:CARDB domain-containing protein n=1 Tax=Hyalangium versicolor TaxID=2861190 RepID=UPI001CCF4C23|nr:CARDB domain-containing protein [Hyalangium versicolor]